MTNLAELPVRMPRPSSLPMLAQCPCFEGQPSDDADAGSLRHQYLEILWRLEQGGNDGADVVEAQEACAEMAEAESDGVDWALEYIKLHAPTLDHPMDFERSLTLRDDNFQVIWRGTPDAVCGSHVFDMKWRERDYVAQMAAYALLIFDDSEFDSLTFHLLYGAIKKAEVFTLTRDLAAEIVSPIIRAWNDENKEPAPCDYCGWCAKAATCPALNERALAVAAGREDWKLEQYHASNITTPEEMDKALILARHLKPWIEAVEYFAKEMTQKQGIQLAHFDLRQKQGSQFCIDINRAFELLNLDPKEFLSACALRLNSSRSHQERKGIIEAYAAHHCLSKKEAKKKVETLLAEVLKRGNPTFELRKKKSSAIEELEEENAIDV